MTVALDVPMRPDPERIEMSLLRDDAGLPLPIHVASSVDAGVSSLDIAAGFFDMTAEFVDSPAPWRDVKWASDHAAGWWPDAWESMRSHMAQIAISLARGRGDVLERMLVLTKVVAAVAESVDAVGIYWRSGRAVQSVPDFCDLSREASRDNLPLTLWISFGLYEISESQRQLSTIGMESLGCREIEIGPNSLSFDEMLELAWWVAYQILDSDLTVERGDFFVDDAGVEYLVSLEHSRWDRPGDVLRLDLKS